MNFGQCWSNDIAFSKGQAVNDLSSDFRKFLEEPTNARMISESGPRYNPSTNNSLGNIIIVNICASILSKKLDLKVVNYGNVEDWQMLYRPPHADGRQIVEPVEWCDQQQINALTLKDEIPEVNHGIDVCTLYFQDADFIRWYKDDIKNHFNKFRFITDLLVHVRLGDIANISAGIDYYRHCINNIDFESGFIASDDPKHEIVRTLAEEYNLQIYHGTPTKTLVLGASARNLVLSGGTFSWAMGVASSSDNIYYPIYPVGKRFYGDIFVFENWNGIEI